MADSSSPSATAPGDEPDRAARAVNAEARSAWIISGAYASLLRARPVMPLSLANLSQNPGSGCPPPCSRNCPKNA